MFDANGLERGVHVLVALLHACGFTPINVDTLRAYVLQYRTQDGVFKVYLDGVGRYEMHPVLDNAFTRLVENGEVQYEPDQTHLRVSEHVAGQFGHDELQAFSPDEQALILALADILRSLHGRHVIQPGD